MSKRLSFRQYLPEFFDQVTLMDKAVESSGVDPLLLELIKIRASQINGCAYCMNAHIQDAIKKGENPKRLYVLSNWREAKNWFSKEDQAVLKFTEEVTNIGANGLSDATYEEVVAIFGEENTAKLLLGVIHINSLNRVGVALSMHPF